MLENKKLLPINTNKFLLLTLFVLAVFKCLLLLINHVQEDAFITWRVARNIIEYGVYGFNGLEKVSASTTHLYVFVSCIFRLLFGDNFIFPILIFNSLLFLFTTYLFSTLFFKDNARKIVLIITLNLLPPALKISMLGMEYAILFFFEVVFLKYGIINKKKWVLFLLPILIIWTRIDTVIFLGLAFLFNSCNTKKINITLFLSCIVGVISVIAFNYLYFGDIVNNTIVAKSIAYKVDKTMMDRFWEMFMNFNYYSMVKIPPQHINYFFLFISVASFYCFYKIRNILSPEAKVVLPILYVFAWIKTIIFGFANSWFDWYYWVPQIIFCLPILLFFINKEIKFKRLFIYAFFLGLPIFFYQIIHSIATAKGEWGYSREIGLYIGKIEPDKTKTMYLEAAGYPSYFSGLTIIDYVGLVDKRVTEEFTINYKKVPQAILEKYKPDYILEFSNPMFKSISVVSKNEIDKYTLIKEFKIKDNARSSNKILDFIYKLKPSGRDYYLYKRKIE